MKCVMCGSQTSPPVLKVIPFDAMPGVYLKDIQVHECPTCHETYEDIPALGVLVRRLAKIVSEQPQPLTGPAMEFLRKAIGWSVEDMAKRLGVSPAKLSEWETAGGHPPRRVEEFVRVLAKNTKPVDSYEKIDRPRKATSASPVYFLTPTVAAQGVSWRTSSVPAAARELARAEAK